MENNHIALKEKISAPSSLDGKDFLLWNLFRYLDLSGDKNWLRDLFKESYRANFLVRTDFSDADQLEMKFWYGGKEKIFNPPPEYHNWLSNRWEELSILSGEPDGPGTEGSMEIDLVLETPGKLIFLEAFLDMDMQYYTHVDPMRDQLCRILDVGSYFAKRNNLEFFFILITPDLPYGTRFYQYRMHEFFHHPLGIKEKLPYRKDLSWHDLSSHIGWINWEQVIKIWEKYVLAEGLLKQDEMKQLKSEMALAVQKVQA